MMTPDTPNLVQLFTEQMSLEEGSRDEQGFALPLQYGFGRVNGDVIRSQADPGRYFRRRSIGSGCRRFLFPN